MRVKKVSLACLAALKAIAVLLVRLTQPAIFPALAVVAVSRVVLGRTAILIAVAAIAILAVLRRICVTRVVRMATVVVMLVKLVGFRFRIWERLFFCGCIWAFGLGVSG